MRFILFTIAGLLMSNLSLATIKCSDAEQKITIDPHQKKVSILKSGHTTNLKIISQNQHGYKMFGEKVYEVPGGYALGIKTDANQNKKLTIFKNGEPVSSIPNCSL